MTRQPVVATEEDSSATALQEMRRRYGVFLPSAGMGKLVGILSRDDVLDGLAAELQNVAGSIRNEQQIESALRP